MQRKKQLEDITSKAMEGIKPTAAFDIPAIFSASFTVALFKFIWISQLYSIYNNKPLRDSEEGKDTETLKANVRDSLMRGFGFSHVLCRTKSLLLKAFWTHKNKDATFDQQMNDLVRIKRSLTTDIYFDREIEEFAQYPIDFTLSEFEKWYKTIEKRYAKTQCEGFSEAKEDQLYKWKSAPSKVQSALSGFFSKLNVVAQNMKETSKSQKKI